MDKVLIDTDVILDFFLDRLPHSNYAAEILELSEREIIRAYVTPVMICNCYYILRKTATHEKVVNSIKLLLTIVDVASMDHKAVLNALNSKFKDLEDALQHFSAKRDKELKVILTRNIKDYKESTIAVMTPEIYLKTISKN